MKKEIKKGKTESKKTTIKEKKVVKKDVIEEKHSNTNDSKTLLMAITLFAVGIIVGMLVINNKPAKINNVIKSDDKDFAKLYNDIKKNYFGEIKDDYDEKIMTSMVKELNDPFSSIYEGTEAINYKETINNKFIGIGAEVLMDENNNIVIINTFDNSPAEKAGIEKNDIILKVDGRDIVGMEVIDAVSLIKGGNENDLVELTILRNGEEKIISISKSIISQDTVNIEYLNNDIARVSISYFANTTYQELRNKLDELNAKGIKKIALDLRNNYFGSMDIARDIADLFLDKGKIIYKEETKNGSRNYLANNNKEYDFEMVLVTNEFTINKSEMLACSLIDNLGVKVIGKKTASDNSIQKTYELKNNSIIEFTIGKWLSPNGNDISENGINIDYEEEESNINSKIIEILDYKNL